MSTNSISMHGDEALQQLNGFNFMSDQLIAALDHFVNTIDSLETKTNVYWIDEYFNYWPNIKKELNKLTEMLVDDREKFGRAINGYEDEAGKQKE